MSKTNGKYLQIVCLLLMLFVTGCGTRKVDKETPSTVAVNIVQNETATTAQPTTQDTSSKMEFWEIKDMANLYFDDTHENITDMYVGLEVTGKLVADVLDIYHGKDYEYYILDGNKRISLDTDGKYAYFTDGVAVMQREGFLTKQYLRIGTAKQEYLDKMATDAAKLASRTGALGLEPAMMYEGVFVEGQMLKEIAGTLCFNVTEVSKMLGFSLSTQGTDIVCSGMGIEITISTTDPMVSLNSAYTRKFAEKHPDDTTMRFLNVGNRPIKVLEGVSNPYWAPVEYLTDVFGITYTYDMATNVVTLTGGSLLPRTVLLDTKELVNLYEPTEIKAAEDETSENNTDTKEEKGAEENKDAGKDKDIGKDKDAGKGEEPGKESERESSTISSGFQLG